MGSVKYMPRVFTHSHAQVKNEALKQKISEALNAFKANVIAPEEIIQRTMVGFETLIHGTAATKNQRREACFQELTKGVCEFLASPTIARELKYQVAKAFIKYALMNNYLEKITPAQVSALNRWSENPEDRAAASAIVEELKTDEARKLKEQHDREVADATRLAELQARIARLRS